MNGLRKAFLFLFFLCFTLTHVLAQQDCADVVRVAVETVAEYCSAVGRNQACYGNFYLEAQPQTGVTDFVFAERGDIVDVSTVQSLSLSSQIEDEGIWGIALMSLQANLPNTLPGQNVTLLAFGQVDITNAVETNGTPVQLEVTAVGSANIRINPSTTAGIVTSLTAGETLIADGRLADGSWIRVQLTDGDIGWIFADLLTSSGDLSTLNVVEPSAPVFSAMQAFYFQTGVGDAPCAEVPDSGILIQTPEGSGEISLLVDAVDIRLGSTLYLQAAPDGDMFVYVLEGRAEVSALGTTVTAPAGTFVTIVLDDTMTAAATPTNPAPYDLVALANLPLSLLPQAITIAAPLDEASIAAIGLPRTGTWSSVVVSTDCEEVESNSTIGVTVSADGSSISFDDGTTFSRIATGSYALNSAEAQLSLQVISEESMSLSINNIAFACSAQIQLSYIG